MVEILCTQAYANEKAKNELDEGLHVCLPLEENFAQIKFGFLRIRGFMKRMKLVPDTRGR